MMDIKEREDLTGPVVSEPQGPAGAGGTVPAPPPSSSNDGLPPGSAGGPGGELATSVAALGMRRLFPTLVKGRGKSPARRSAERETGARAGPALGAPGPSSSRAGDRDACFKRPGPLSSKGGRVRPTAAAAVDPTIEDSASGAASESDSEMSLSEAASETGSTQSRGSKRGRGRPPTTGEWVGVEGVRHDLELLKKKLEAVERERDILAGRFEVDFGPTAGGLPSAGDVRGELAGETVDALLSVVSEEMEAVERVAERSRSLKGNLQRRLRAATRRALAASQVLFSRAQISAGEGTERGALERARRDLEAARGLFEESQERVRRLEEEVRVLRARETVRADKAKRAARAGRILSPTSPSPPPLGAERGIEAMETEMEGSPALRASPPPPISARAEPLVGPAASQDLLVERIAARVFEMLRSERGVLRPTEPSGPPPAEGRELWSEVVGRKARRTRGKAGASVREGAPPPAPAGGDKAGSRKRKKRKGPKKGTGGAPAGKAPLQKKKKERAPPGVIREPKTAAVLVTVAPEAGVTLGEALRTVRPAALEATRGTGASLSVKRAQAGGTLIQISGGEGPRLSGEMVAGMRRLLEGRPGVRVTRPQKRAELRLQGLEDSVTRQEIVEAVTGLTECCAEDLSVGEIRFLPGRMGSAWMRCPVSAYNKMVEAGRLRVGLAVAAVKPLPARRMRCFRCLEVGHGVAGCKGPDRSGRCHRCGDRSHLSRLCPSGRPKCPLCVDFGLPDGHTLGAAACVSSTKVARRRIAALALEKSKANEKGKGQGPRSSAKEDAALTASGGGSKGGPRRAKPPETSAPAGPARAGRVTRSMTGLSPGASKKGSTDGGEDRQAGPSSLKRTRSDRSSAAQLEKEGARATDEERPRIEVSLSPPPPHEKKRKAQRERSMSLN